VNLQLNVYMASTKNDKSQK